MDGVDIWDLVAEELTPEEPDVVPEPHQMPPEGDWTGWCLLGGRRSGKSFALALYLRQYVREFPEARCRIIAPTFGDAVESCVRGPSGLLTLDPDCIWKPSAPGGSLIVWPWGAECLIMGTKSAREVERLRATGGRSLDWFEEAAANPMISEAFEQAKLGRNYGPRPRWIASTTPRPIPILKEWMADPGVEVRRATTHDNPHLPESYRSDVDSAYKGSRLYRQEVLGEILEDVEGALWTPDMLDSSRISREDEPEMIRILVGVDPPSGPGTCGIVVVGMDVHRHLYVLDDVSTEGRPEKWGAAVARASDKYSAPVLVEKNQGGQMVLAVLENAGVRNVKTTWASKGKFERAEPVALLWDREPASAHMVGRHELLEDQLVTWLPGDRSPDRLDAMVHACNGLLGQTASSPSRLVSSADLKDSMVHTEPSSYDNVVSIWRQGRRPKRSA